MARSDGKTGWQILIADPEYTTAVAELAPRFETLRLVCPADGEGALALASSEIDGLVTQAGPVDRALLEALPGARVVLKLGRNYENVDAAAVRERDLIFASVPRKGPNCVAELALTLILALSKDLLISHESVAEGDYRLRGLRPTQTSQSKIAFHWMHNTRVHEVRGKVLGIVGMGEIGCELARRADILGMRTVYYKRRPLSPELERHFNAEYRGLDALLQESDYICLAVPHTPDTERMIGREQLALMKESAYLINVCRGGVVDEEALIAALTANQIAGAGLDVFTLEPLPAGSPLCQMDNVILTPHIGGGTGTTRALELGEALEEMARILSGEPPQNDLRPGAGG
ncbi:MAG: 2-hydroxyacid dehydrogenase [Ardenticatenaceae bacterium]|nr:2-hydroxyacid dehydrogenase [Ardenticatenaceae bacterium]